MTEAAYEALMVVVKLTANHAAEPDTVQNLRHTLTLLLARLNKLWYGGYSQVQRRTDNDFLAMTALQIYKII